MAKSKFLYHKQLKIRFLIVVPKSNKYDHLQVDQKNILFITSPTLYNWIAKFPYSCVAEDN